MLARRVLNMVIWDSSVQKTLKTTSLWNMFWCKFSLQDSKESQISKRVCSRHAP